MPLLDNQILDRFAQTPMRPRPAEHHAQILQRARHLIASDRLIVELVLKHNLPRRQLARMLGIPAGSVSRRLRRISARLYCPLVIALLDPHCRLNSEYRQIGIERFLQGQTMQQIAQAHQISLCEVRQIISFVRGWHRGASSARTGDASQ